MALATFERVEPLLFTHEGGYSGHKHDNGNWTGGKVGSGRLVGTKYGIAAPTLAGWRGTTVTADDMRNLTREEAVQIYKAQYWDTIRGDDLPVGVDYCVYDYSVNSGPGRAAKDLQRVVGATADGVIGPQTLNAVMTCGKSSPQIIDEICDRRLAFMKRLKSWKHFGKGWSRRVAEVRSKAKQFVMNYPVTDQVPEDDIPTPRAKPEDRGVSSTLTKPETWLPFVGGGGGLLSAFTEPGPLQWALAAGVVVAVGVGAFYIIRRIQRDDD